MVSLIHTRSLFPCDALVRMRLHAWLSQSEYNLTTNGLVSLVHRLLGVDGLQQQAVVANHVRTSIEHDLSLLAGAMAPQNTTKRASQLLLAIDRYVGFDVVFEISYCW